VSENLSRLLSYESVSLNNKTNGFVLPLLLFPRAKLTLAKVLKLFVSCQKGLALGHQIIIVASRQRGLLSGKNFLYRAKLFFSIYFW
jgi:hypothetical protein